MAKILIVEDDALMSRMFQKIFAFGKYEVEVAKDGEEGLAKITASPPDLVLLDIMMPKLNGLQVLEKLKSDAKTKNIPVIMLTNLSDKNSAEIALKKGAVKYIVKSEQDPKTTADMVEQIITGHSPNQSPSPTPSPTPTP